MSILSPEITIPLAYFITFTCYGTWLSHEKEISVNIKKNTFGTRFLAKYLVEDYKNLNKASPVLLDSNDRNIILNTLKEVSDLKNWSLLAAHVRTNHVHVIINASEKPEIILNTFKAYATRNLNKKTIIKKRWTRHGSTRYLWNVESVEAAIKYVIEEQGEPMTVFEDKNRELLIY